MLGKKRRRRPLIGASAVIALSLMTRFRSRQEQSFAGKVVAALRHQFGGHAVQGNK